jgi:hypothetical protein
MFQRFIIVFVASMLSLGSFTTMATSLGGGAAPTLTPVQVVEYYNVGLDHYFITADAGEISALDGGEFVGWARTSYQFTAYSPASVSAGTNPVCRFYGRPDAGLDSHFYSASPDECAAVLTKFASSWLLESSDVFQVELPDRATGACSATTIPVYRLFNNRRDANHRYTTDTSTRNAMLARGYIAEGYGPDAVVFCAVATTTSTPPPNSSNPFSVSMFVTQLAADTFDFSSAVASNIAAVVSYAWNFGDGTGGTGPTTSHQFALSGTFPVVLTVTDGTGAVATAAKSVTAGTATSSSPANDFAARKSAPSVVRWFDFDTSQQLGAIGTGNANFGSFSNSGTVANLPVIDSTVAASGTGSLRFDIRSQSFPNAQWFANFSPDLSVRFGENTKFYVQWRQRFNQAFVDTVFTEADGSNQGGIKQFIVGPGDTAMQRWASCEAIHVVTQTYYQNRFVIGYNSCTGSGTHGAYAGFYTTDTDIKYQNGTAPYCLRSGTGRCIGWVADEWMTFQIEITLGPRNNVTNDFDNSTYKLWIARENQPSILVIDWKPGVPGYFPLAAGPQSDDQRFGKVWLLPYMTNVDGTQVHPLAQTWYDELIISRQPINDPGVGTPPPGVSTTPPVVTPSAAGTYPSWRQGRFVNQFFRVPGTANMSGMTSQPCTIDCWNGLGAGPTSLWSAAAGGDGDPLNAVISIDLAADTPKWVLNHAPSASSSYSLTSPYYLDGMPVGRHTYFSTQYITAAHDRNGVDRVMLFSDFAAYGVNRSGSYGGGPQVDGFRVATGRWDAAGTWQNTPFWDSSPMTFAKDPRTEDVFMAGGYRFAKWNAATGLFTEFTPVGGASRLLAWDDLPSVVDGKRGRFVAIHDGRPYYNVGVIRLQAIDIVANTYVDIPVTGAITALPGTGGAMVHDTDNDRYLLFWTHGGGTTDVFAINPDTGASSLVGNVSQPMVHTMYGRAAYMPALGGVAYLPSYASEILFMPTR